MKQKLHRELNALLDFYHRQRAALPASHAHASGVIDKPSFFTCKDLQRHLNNPLLKPEWVHVKLDGKRVELEKSCFFKMVQARKLEFMDKEPLNEAIARGAAVVLEGIDILEPEVNRFVARLDESLPCVMANSVVFFSQQDSEAYEGHCDADDVLVVQLEGRKIWQLFAPQQRRYADIQNLDEQQLGPVLHEVTMRAGDALYVRAGVPHRCKTPAPHSLHMSFDLVDNSPTAGEIAGEASKLYNRACEHPYAPPGKVVERYVGILESSDFQAALDEAVSYKRKEIEKFRQMIGRASAIRNLGKFS